MSKTIHNFPELKYVQLPDFITESGFSLPLSLSYQSFGPEIGTAPIVLVNHALTGNSNIAGKHGWWNQLIGEGKTIDTLKFTVLAFNIPGNGYEGDASLLINNYQQFTTRDIANAFLLGLQHLNINKLFAVIGGSLGGCISWEMMALSPKLAEHLIPIATDWKASDWLIANVRIQKQILENSKFPLEDARMHAMTFYRSAASFKNKFQRSFNLEKNVFNIESWLNHHGEKLKERFNLSAYKLMNHLLSTTDISRERSGLAEVCKNIQATIHLVNINSDGLYVPEETRETYQVLVENGNKVYYHEIESIHGHDAFLIEYQQLNNFLEPIFSNNKKDKLVRKEKKTVQVTVDPNTSIRIYSTV